MAKPINPCAVPRTMQKVIPRPLKADRDARSEETAAILLERRKLLVKA